MRTGEGRGIYSVAMFHVGAKSALLRRFLCLRRKKRHPPAPLLLLSKPDPLGWAPVWYAALQTAFICLHLFEFRRLKVAFTHQRLKCSGEVNLPCAKIFALQKCLYGANAPPRRAVTQLGLHLFYQHKTIPKALLLNCTPFVRQYDILSNKWGVLLCQKEYQTNDIRRSSREWL